VCDRLAMSSVRKYRRVVVFGAIDEVGFVNAFCRELVREPECVKVLSEAGDLRSRLVRVLELTEENWLFVMDDFEALSGGRSLNLDEVNGAYLMKPEVAAVIGAIEASVWECGGRLLVTSRYEVVGLDRVVRFPLGPMDDREMIKKRRQLAYVAKIAAANESEKAGMQALQSQAEALADGNPRLLMWLDLVLCEVDDPSEIFAALEARALEFRMDVLAERLLALLSRKEREALARGLVFELAVGRAVFESVVGFGDFAQSIGLGLLAVSPELEVRVPRVLGLAVPQDEALAATAARELYAVWEKSESEVQRLEMHRLAIAGKVGPIAAEIGSIISHALNDKSRFQAAVDICRKTLEVTKDFRLHHAMGRSEQSLGNVISAKDCFDRALVDCPDSIEHKVLRERSAIMHNTATLKADQGKLTEALELYNQSLSIKREIDNCSEIDSDLRKDNQQGIAATLHAIATVYRNQGKVEEAIALYEESLAIERSIGNQQGIAATLHAIANVYSNQGKVEEAIALYEESLAIQRSIGNQQGIASTLAMLAQIIAVHQQDFGTAIDYLQQSEAILRRIGSPDAETVAEILQQVERMAK
jgi:tetratricopeptide (TPR) repeat protein